MERVLRKLAKQLNQYDENSLMELWHEYAGKVSHFEPTTQWEEDTLILCLIQAMHWKNQLFNSELAASLRRGQGLEDKIMQAELGKLPKKKFGPKATLPEARTKPRKAVKKSGESGKKPCKILMFRPVDTSEAG